MVPKSGLLLLALIVASCSALAIESRALGENEVLVPGVGNIEGVTSTSSWTQRKIYEFRGYPEKMHSWEPATFKALDFAPACPQPGVPDLPAAFQSLVMKPDEWVLESQRRRTMSPDYDERIIGEENNCLTLDIYTPTLNSSAMLPVLVYIHGGAFISGSSAGHRPGNLLERDMILVVPQYRLGPFGFMYLNDPEAPGNMGLADQALALKWVRNNIEAFGGDPSSITVGGVSAGAASVSLHMLNRNNTGTSTDYAL
ncbi:hypothetical protein B566_EDAN014062 [Ephemera danica]|nr:hypothetical protein B566_EDAN014062 [Ephemera danica]